MYCENNASLNNNMNIEVENVAFNISNTHKLKLDDILDSIKNIRTIFNIPEEIRIATKILKKFKLSETCKWLSELLLSYNNITLNTNTAEKEKNRTDVNSPQTNFENNQNITQKNLNLIFNKQEQLNFSSLLFHSDRESVISNQHNVNIDLQEQNLRTPDNNNLNQANYNQNILTSTNVNNLKGKINFSSSNQSNRLNKLVNTGNNLNNDGLNLEASKKFLNFYNKLKYDEYDIKDIVYYASALFDLKEFVKCSFVLKNYATPKYPTAMFIYYYAEYMIIQQKKQEELMENSDFGSKFYSSKELNNLLHVFSSFDVNNELSPFMLYLYGVILRELRMFKESKSIFIKALNGFPFLWSAWTELTIISKQDEIKTIFSEIEDHWIKYFYLANFLLDKNYEQESIIVSNSLSEIFPNSIFLLNTLAHAFYLLHEYETSQEYFDKLFFLDPHRYENIDTYSNILFIKENYCDLSNLAFKCFQNDKYRPETCCVIGNYYGLKGDHAKAVVYFKRAIKLDNNFLSAWTLMGHEYLEMKSIPAAIESYRTAVDIDPNDYRAWYGLGQTYEIHQMYNYAIYYFLNAAKAKPNDSRMWTALGSCYEKIEKRNEAIKCYEKAVACKDKEGIAMYKMAKLYFCIGEEDKAAICFKENLKRNFNLSEEVDNAEIVESYLFLAKYHKKRAEFDEAYNYLIKLKDHEGFEKDEIHSMMREINNLMSAYNKGEIWNRNNITKDSL